MTPDEVTPIADYMAKEMNRNANGETAKKILQLNKYSAEACIAEYTRLPMWKQMFGLGIAPEQCIDQEWSNGLAALMLWGAKVRQDGEWDHKPKIRKTFHPCVPGEQVWHAYGQMVYYYDVWSNVHYGYVGKAVGFSDDVLLDGAGGEQIVSNLTRFAPPQRDAASQGLRAYDDPSDRIGIQIGSALQKKGAITATALLSAVISASGITKRPFTGPR